MKTMVLPEASAEVDVSESASGCEWARVCICKHVRLFSYGSAIKQARKYTELDNNVKPQDVKIVMTCATCK